MRRVLYPCILVALLAYCNQSSNNCPDLANLSNQPGNQYTAHGKVPADTLSDSFCPLTVGNTWEYEYTWYLTEETGTTRYCGNLSCRVIQRDSGMAIIAIETNSVTGFDTLRITADSIINIDSMSESVVGFPTYIPYLLPILTGPRKHLYPCLKFDDSSGYSYINTGVYFNKYGLTYIRFMPSAQLDEESVLYSSLLQTFNGTSVNVEQHAFEGLTKYNYVLKYPDSIIVSSLSEIIPAKLFGEVIFPSGFKSDFVFLNQPYSKATTLPIFPKKS